MEFIRRLEYLLASGRTMSKPQTIENKIQRANQMLDQIIEPFQKRYAVAMQEAYRDAVLRVAQETGMRPNFHAVSTKEIDRLKRAGLEFMHNYKEDMIRKVKAQLYVSFMNGESYYEAYRRIRPYGNDKARPRVMIRDQMARTYQAGIIEGYGATGNPQDYDYYWTGPEDERTTEICEDRKDGNPYTWDDVKELEYHPHIQCRHRWVAKPKAS